MTAGAWLADWKNTPANTTRQVIIPIIEIIISLLLPYLSTVIMLTTVPAALRKEVTRESAMAVVLEANPANWMMVGL